MGRQIFCIGLGGGGSVKRGQVWKILMLESVASWFSQGQRSRRPNYKSSLSTSWPFKGHVTAMEDTP